MIPTTHPRTATALWLVLGAILLAPTGARAEQPRVAVLPLKFSPELSPAARKIFTQRLAVGLQAGKVKVVTAKPGAPIAKDSTCDHACRREVAAKLGTKYLVGGEIDASFDNYDFNLWLADAETGEAVATIEERCDVCAIETAEDTMNLAASALALKLDDRGKKPAQITVESYPPAAAISVDGKDVGTAPVEVDLAPGKHEIVASLDGHIDARQEVTAVGSVQEKVTLTLIPGSEDASRWKTIVGWTAVGVGVAAAVAGVALLAADGKESGCGGEIFTDRCSEKRETAAAGGVLLGVGAAAAIGGGALLLVRRKAPAERPTVAITPAATGLLVHGNF